MQLNQRKELLTCKECGIHGNLLFGCRKDNTTIKCYVPMQTVRTCVQELQSVFKRRLISFTGQKDQKQEHVTWSAVHARYSTTTGGH